MSPIWGRSAEAVLATSRAGRATGTAADPVRAVTPDMETVARLATDTAPDAGFFAVAAIRHVRVWPL